MNIIILATRISGNDGVSLECEHWREILVGMGHKVTFVAGQLDRAGVVLPELHFQWPHVMELHDKVTYGKGKYSQIEANIFDIAGTIEGKLRHFFNRKRKVDLLIVPNILSLPMHFPLAVALTRVIGEYKIPTIARHHDFWWERPRYRKSHLFPFFKRWFPPDLPEIRHVVINSYSRDELKKRTGLEAEIISDSFDFSKTKMLKVDSYSKHFRQDFGISKDDLVFLQATRIIPRKRVELSIEFMKKLNNLSAVLIVSGHAGDEGREYFEMIKSLAKVSNIRYKFIGNYVNSKRRLIQLLSNNGPLRKRVYTLWDCYRNADFILYPTKVEGFGNQLVESVFFKKPIILTPYSVYERDIKPLGFENIEMGNKKMGKAINKVNQLLINDVSYQNLIEKNFELGEKYFSYNWVERKLNKLFKEMDLTRAVDRD